MDIWLPGKTTMKQKILINKKKAKILGMVIVGSIAPLIILLYLGSRYEEGVNNQLQNQDSGTGYYSNLPEESNIYRYRASQIDLKNQKQVSQDGLVGLLLTKLPYEGLNFSLYYNFQTNQFIVRKKTNDIASFTEEFAGFLNANHIKSKDWLYNLTIY